MPIVPKGGETAQAEPIDRPLLGVRCTVVDLRRQTQSEVGAGGQAENRQPSPWIDRRRRRVIEFLDGLHQCSLHNTDQLGMADTLYGRRAGPISQRSDAAHRYIERGPIGGQPVVHARDEGRLLVDKAAALLP